MATERFISTVLTPKCKNDTFWFIVSAHNIQFQDNSLSVLSLFFFCHNSDLTWHLD